MVVAVARVNRNVAAAVVVNCIVAGAAGDSGVRADGRIVEIIRIVAAVDKRGFAVAENGI